MTTIDDVANKGQTKTHWLLAIETSTSRGGAALLRDGNPVASVLLEEGLRHGRELLPAVERLLGENNISPGEVCSVAVSVGPGSYTGLRVGVMAAKAFAYAVGCRLAGVSSLAALAQTLVLSRNAEEGGAVFLAQDARRDEVYVGAYRIRDGIAKAIEADRAAAPEEAAAWRADLEEKENREGKGRVLCAGSAFVTYAEVFAGAGREICPGGVNPAAVGALGWRQILLEEFADPMNLQPVYLRRDGEGSWRRDALIAGN